MSAYKHLIAAGVAAAVFSTCTTAAYSESCASQGGHGDWRYTCEGESCTLEPTRVITENQHGTVEDPDFPFFFVVGPSARIAIELPPDTVADRLEITYSGDIFASATATDGGSFSIAPGKAFVDVGRALESGKRLLLVFIDTSRRVNTAVAALAHDGFAETFRSALAAAEAAAAGQTCP
jgi:hypothetical protein